jgi:hypothetical protein
MMKSNAGGRPRRLEICPMTKANEHKDDSSTRVHPRTQSLKNGTKYSPIIPTLTRLNISETAS